MSTKGTALSINMVMTSAIKGATFLQASIKGVHTYAKPLQKIDLLKSTKFPLLKKNLQSLENHLGKIRSQTAKISANPIKLEIKASRDSLKEARKDMTAIANEAQKARNYTKLSAQDMEQGAEAKYIKDTSERDKREAREENQRIKQAEKERLKRKAQMKSRLKVAGGAVATTAVGAFATLNPVRKSIVFESAMADVKKATNADDEKIEVLKQNILGIVSSEKGSLFEPSQIALIQAGGGRSGVKVPDLPSFTKDIAMASIAMDLPVEQVGVDFAKMAERMDIPISKISILTNSFTHLENNSANLGRDLINTTGRLSGVFRGLKFEPQNAAAISSYMNTLKVSPELAASSFQILMDRFKKTDDKFGYYKKLQKEGAGALKSIIKEIDSKMTPQQQIKVFGTQGEDVIGAMSSKLDALDKSLATVADTKMKTAVASEYAVKMATTEAREIASKNKITVESILMGDKMKDTYITVVEAIPKAIVATTTFYTENKELIHTVGGVVLKLGAVAVALKMVSWIASPFIGLARSAFNYRTQIASIARFGYGFLKTTAVIAYKVALGALAITAKVARTAIFLMGGALKMAGRAVLFMSRALLLNPIGLAVTAIAGGAYLIYSNWSSVKTFFSGVWSSIKSTFNSGIAVIKTLFSWSPVEMVAAAWTPIKPYFSGLVNAIKSPFVNFFGWIANKFEWIGNMVKRVKGWTSNLFGEDEESKTLEERREIIPKALRPETIEGLGESKIVKDGNFTTLADQFKPLNNTEYQGVFKEPTYFKPQTTFSDVNEIHEKHMNLDSNSVSKGVNVGIDNINVQVSTTDGKFNNDDFVEQVNRAMKEISWDDDNTRYGDSA